MHGASMKRSHPNRRSGFAGISNRVAVARMNISDCRDLAAVAVNEAVYVRHMPLPIYRGRELIARCLRARG